MQLEDCDARHLVEAAANGDSTSWERLLSDHLGRLARLVAVRLDRRLQGRVDPDDVIQEICLEAWKHLPEYQKNPTFPFYLWLRGLARNKLLEIHRHHLKTKMRDARRETADFPPTAHETTTEVLGSVLMDSQTSPSRAAMREEIKARLQSAVESMEELDCEVLVLRHFEQLSPVETAQILGIQEKAAGMRYVRAMKRLRAILATLPGGLSSFRI